VDMRCDAEQVMTWYIDAMDVVRLHFPEPDTQALRLSEGNHDIGWRDGRLGPVDDTADALMTVSVGQRGIWMNVSSRTACVHVNGRRIYQLALLRSGDVIHLDSAEFRLIADPRPLPAQLPTPSKAMQADPRLVLRALGGPDHGRCFTLNHPCLAGRSAGADLRIDDILCGEHHAWLERDQAQVLLRHPQAGGRSMVNGQALHEAVLVAGDQIAFTSRHRFVLESPATSTPQEPATAFPELTPARSRALRPLIWLLLAAAGVAVLLTWVLLFGTA